MKLENIIYPNTNIIEGKLYNTYYIKIFTNIRKLHNDGKWYLSKVYFDGRKDISDDNSIFIFRQESMNHFLSSVYNFQLLGIVDTNLRLDNDFYHGDDKVFVLDKNQDSEEERIKKLLEWKK